jgi:hypothetical protein
MSAQSTPKWVLLLGGIGAAVVIAAGSIAAALINHSPPVPELRQTPVATTASGSSHGTASSSRTSERRTPYKAGIRESSFEGDVIWPDNGPPRLSGQLKFRGGRQPCSVKLTFEARSSNGNSIEGDERRCDNTPAWPSYEWSVPSKHASETAQIDILAKTGDEVVTRITCTRSGDCSTS